MLKLLINQITLCVLFMQVVDAQLTEPSVQEPVSGGNAFVIYKRQGFHSDSQAVAVEAKSYTGTPLAITIVTAKGQQLEIFPMNSPIIIPYPNTLNCGASKSALTLIDKAGNWGSGCIFFHFAIADTWFLGWDGEMARSIRIEFPGASYHVMARGNCRQGIFVDDDDRRFFLRCLGEVCEKTGWRVHAWVLMGNHYHLFIETPEANLVEGMKWFQNTVTRRFNTRHQEWGRLFGDRYKAVLVEAQLPAYHTTLWDYIHLNPCRAGLVDYTKGGSLLDYPWSSLAGGFALLPAKRPAWLASAEVFAMLGYPDTPGGRREMVDYLDQRGRTEGKRSGIPAKAEGLDRRLSDLKKGWYWGRQEFAEQMLKMTGALGKARRSRAYKRTPEIQEHGEVRAREILNEELKKEGLGKEQLHNLRASDPRKVAIAQQIWKETTVSQSWIAEHLAMRNAANVSLSLHRRKERRISV